MADGGQTVDQWDIVDLAARRLAKALGYGPSWFADVREVADDERAYETTEGVDRFGIVRRGHVAEQAARSISGSGRVKRQHRWSQIRGVAALPLSQPDTDAVGALSFAKLDGPLEAILLLYATGDMPRYWPRVQLFAVACFPGSYAELASTDAMMRLLARRAVVAQDDRAKQLHIRAADYRRITGSFETTMRRWLYSASARLLRSLQEEPSEGPSSTVPRPK